MRQLIKKAFMGASVSRCWALRFQRGRRGMTGVLGSWEGLGLQEAVASRTLKWAVTQWSLEIQEPKTVRPCCRLAECRLLVSLCFYTPLLRVSSLSATSPAQQSQPLVCGRMCMWAECITEPLYLLWCLLGYRQREEVWITEPSTWRKGIYLASLLWAWNWISSSGSQLNHSLIYSSGCTENYRRCNLAYQHIRSILIICRFHICKITRLIKFICNTKVNTQGGLAVIQSTCSEW